MRRQPLEGLSFFINSLYQKHTVTNKKRRNCGSFFPVIRLGLEPKTPSLKGMCSTC